MIFQAEPSQRETATSVRLEFPTGAEAPAQARAALCRLQGMLSPACLDIVGLVLSELVTNAVRHSGAGRSSPLTVDVECGRSAVRVTVTDSGSGFDPTKRGGPRGADGGWGLYVVGEVAERWWVEQTGEGARVVAEIARA